jgi:hemerythrin-like domain-containing protein
MRPDVAQFVILGERPTGGCMGDHDSEIDGLIDEHRELMTTMAALRRALDDPNADVQGLLNQLEGALAHHTDREESGLFNVLRQVEVPEQYMGLFEHDHSHLVDLLHASQRDRDSVGALLNSLESHMAREENDMFPAAEQLLSPADWETVEAAVADLR